jgi:hypothetical protein
MRRDIDEALRGWPFDPDAGEILAREVKARDGRAIVQVRVELGILQMEVEGRPDGERPHGFTTYLDFMRHRVASRGREAGSSGAGRWTMSTEHCTESDREFVQFYQRRVAWLSIQRYDRALRDADHTLALMDFVARHGINEDYISAHERLRGLVLFHRTQAAAAMALERRRPDEAIEVVQDGSDRLVRHHRSWCESNNDEDEIPDLPLLDQLRQLEEEIRKNFAVEKTLREQLEEAVALEDYEKAARLRDEIRARGRR